MLKLATTRATRNDTVPLGSLGYLHVVATTGPIAHKTLGEWRGSHWCAVALVME